MLNRIFFATLLSLFLNVLILSNARAVSFLTPTPGYDDKIRIREAIFISNQYGDSLWEGFKSTPFPIVLVTDSVEFLFFHDNPTDDFSFCEFDTLTGSNVYSRPRIYDKSFQATFFAVNGQCCVVMGIPENTQSRHSSRWVITLLHERFHQYQYNHSDYFPNSLKLGLSGGDDSGMWQLNYPFPYENASVNDAYSHYAYELYKCLGAIGTPEFESSLSAFIEAKRNFRNALSDIDYSYYSFQLWQEGIARYTEYKFLELMDDYDPSPEFKALPDYREFGSLRERVYQIEKNNIIMLKLDRIKRDCFYSIGFEGLILDEVNPNWRNEYFTNMFRLDNCYPW